MITKYITPALGVGVIALSGLVWYMNGTITDLNKEVAQLEILNEICEVNKASISHALDVQNESIDKFNEILVDKNKDLEEVSKQNSKLKKSVDDKVREIDKISHNTCEETMDWMLKEAINENNTISAN